MGPVPRLDQTDEVTAFPLREGRTKPDRIRPLETTKTIPFMMGVEREADDTQSNAALRAGLVVFDSCAARPSLGLDHSVRKKVPKHQRSVRQRPKTTAHPSCEVCFLQGDDSRKTFWTNKS